MTAWPQLTVVKYDNHTLPHSHRQPLHRGVHPGIPGFKPVCRPFLHTCPVFLHHDGSKSIDDGLYACASVQMHSFAAAVKRFPDWFSAGQAGPLSDTPQLGCLAVGGRLPFESAALCSICLNSFSPDLFGSRTLRDRTKISARSEFPLTIFS